MHAQIRIATEDCPDYQMAPHRTTLWAPLAPADVAMGGGAVLATMGAHHPADWMDIEDMGEPLGSHEDPQDRRVVLGDTRSRVELHAADDVEPLIEAVDGQGTATGVLPKLAAHHAPGVRHRAFSLFALSASGALVLQRRAAVKYHSPLLLTNTVCGHPLPGEPPADAVRRRCVDELGGTLAGLREVGTVSYHVVDEHTGLHENEFNHVFVARIDPEKLRPAPDEVDEVVVIDADAFRDLRMSETFTAWFDTVLAVAAPALAERGFGAAHEPRN